MIIKYLLLVKYNIDQYFKYYINVSIQATSKFKWKNLKVLNINLLVPLGIYQQLEIPSPELWVITLKVILIVPTEVHYEWFVLIWNLISVAKFKWSIFV